MVEFLLGRYCASTDPDKGARCALEKRSYSRPAPVIRAAVKIIDIVRARLDTRLDTRSDSYAAEVPSLAIKDAQIDDELVRANERMLTDGFYAEVSLEYDPVIAQERNVRPFRIAGLRPIQMFNPNVLGILAKGRAAFTTDEWRDFLIRSIGIEPTALDERAKIVVLLRLAPFSAAWSANTTWSASMRWLGCRSIRRTASRSSRARWPPARTGPGWIRLCSAQASSANRLHLPRNAPWHFLGSATIPP